jgi:hypothetical protein
MVFIKNQTISNSPKIWFFGFNTVYTAWTVQYGQVLHYIPVGIVEGRVEYRVVQNRLCLNFKPNSPIHWPLTRHRSSDIALPESEKKSPCGATFRCLTWPPDTVWPYDTSRNKTRFIKPKSGFYQKPNFSFWKSMVFPSLSPTSCCWLHAFLNLSYFLILA